MLGASLRLRRAACVELARQSSVSRFLSGRRAALSSSLIGLLIAAEKSLSVVLDTLASARHSSGRRRRMADAVWRPLSVQTEEQVAEYDALHEGVPEWIDRQFWNWVCSALGNVPEDWNYFFDGKRGLELNCPLMEEMGVALRLSVPDEIYTSSDSLWAAIKAIQRASVDPLDVADYLLAHSTYAHEEEIDELLQRGNSKWKVGERNGFKGLERRVPEGVQVAADHAMQEGGRSGRRLAHAWELLYGVRPDPTGAYAEAVKAVEGVACPLLCPDDRGATLGKAINIVRTQHWHVPMSKQDDRAPTEDVLEGMMRVLWHGQHDRHDDGEPSAPGKVSLEEATVAVGLAVTLIHWFAAGLVVRA